MNTWPERLRWVYAAGLVLVAGGLPWSVFLMSLGQLVLAGAWLLEWALVQQGPPRWNRITGRVPVLLAMAAFLPYPIGLLWSSDLNWGLDLARITLPLLLMPFLLSAMPPLGHRWREGLLFVFSMSLFVTTIVGVVRFQYLDSSDFRDLSWKVDHIRMGMFVCLGIVLSVFWFRRTSAIRTRLLLVLLVSWYLIYLAAMASLQSFAVLALLATLALIDTARRRQGIERLGAVLCTVALLVVPPAYLAFRVQDYFDAPRSEMGALPMASAQGENYEHLLEGPVVERGRWVWTHLAVPEMEQAWSTRSEMPLHGNDRQGQPLFRTAVRYMSSLGLTKDAAGVAALSDPDVRRIEQGIAWADHGRRNKLSERVDEIIFELDQYRHGGDPSGSSVAMRLEFWKAALRIIAAHPWTGVGTGDTPEAFREAYLGMDSQLRPEMRMRAHQQYLTFAVSWGIPLALLMLVLLLLPAWLMRRSGDPRIVPLLVIVLISFLSDDTLERQAGVTFFTFFYGLFLFATASEETSRYA